MAGRRDEALSRTRSFPNRDPPRESSTLSIGLLDEHFIISREPETLQYER